MLLAGALLLCASGCVAPGAKFENIGQRINDRYAGLPFSMMVVTYGPPHRQMAIGSQTIYSWEKAFTKNFSDGPMYLQCRLDAIVSGNTTVQVNLDGNNGACIEFL